MNAEFGFLFFIFNLSVMAFNDVYHKDIYEIIVPFSFFNTPFMFLLRIVFAFQ